MQKINRKRVQNHDLEKPPKKTKTDNELHKISITDAVVLAALTVFSYIFHYFFEYGYLSYFDIPAAFISFNLTEMIPAIFFLVVTYFIFVFVLWPYISYLLGVLPGFIKTILILSPWLIIFVFLGFSWEIILLLFFSILLVFGIDQLKNYRERKNVGKAIDPDPNSNQLKSKREKTVSVETKTSFDPLVNKIIPYGNRFVLFYILFTALVGSMALGRIVAVTRTSFPVTVTSQRCAVVYTTTDRVICKPFNNNKTFENTFHIFNLQGYQNFEFRNEAIGPLHPKPTAIISTPFATETPTRIPTQTITP